LKGRQGDYPAEIISESTFNNGFKKNVLDFTVKRALLKYRFVICGGDKIEFSDGTKAIDFREAAGIFE